MRPRPPARIRPEPAAGRGLAASVLLHVVVLSVVGAWYGSPATLPTSPERTPQPIRAVSLITPIARPEAQVPDVASAEPARANEREADDEEDEPATEAAPDAAANAGAAPNPFRPGFSDSRLYVDQTVRRLRSPPPRPSAQAAFDARVRAEDLASAQHEQEERRKREITVFGRRVPIFGDSAAATWRTPTLVVGGKRMIMPTDGREWEEREMLRQRQEFIADSILRERRGD